MGSDHVGAGVVSPVVSTTVFWVLTLPTALVVAAVIGLLGPDTQLGVRTFELAVLSLFVAVRFAAVRQLRGLVSPALSVTTNWMLSVPIVFAVAAAGGWIPLRPAAVTTWRGFEIVVLSLVAATNLSITEGRRRAWQRQLAADADADADDDDEDEADDPTDADVYDVL
ncbi:hypothetical protein BRD17_08415 [Halobacteriales archaeon SW_7_68_16]|nr:MAG: hypothetical protein BRD17_08415 [Halobacteriales archaeon SW_7_68_16]